MCDWLMVIGGLPFFKARGRGVDGTGRGEVVVGTGRRVGRKVKL